MSGNPNSAPGPNPDNQWSEGAPLPRWALWLMLPGIIGPLLIFIFILRTESAQKNCPFTELTRRAVGPSLTVVEERRSCIQEVEERRYTLLRGAMVRRLGERSFATTEFAPKVYSWTATISPQGEVQLKVRNAGHPDALFREGTVEEHEKGISR